MKDWKCIFFNIVLSLHDQMRTQWVRLCTHGRKVHFLLWRFHRNRPVCCSTTSLVKQCPVRDSSPTRVSKTLKKSFFCLFTVLIHFLERCLMSHPFSVLVSHCCTVCLCCFLSQVNMSSWPSISTSKGKWVSSWSRPTFLALWLSSWLKSLSGSIRNLFRLELFLVNKYKTLYIY